MTLKVIRLPPGDDPSKRIFEPNASKAWQRLAGIDESGDFIWQKVPLQVAEHDVPQALFGEESAPRGWGYFYLD